MLYTLIAYKENSVDTCRGCVTDAYDSAFEAWTGSEPEELANRWAALRDRNSQRERGEAEFVILLLIDGVPAPRCYGYIENFDKGDEARETVYARQEALSEQFEYLEQLTNAKLNALDQERIRVAQEAARKAAEAKEAAERKRAEAKEAAERAEFARLSAKFGGGA